MTYAAVSVFVGRPGKSSWSDSRADPRRVAILLLGGNKAGNDRWYEENVPRADALFDQHLAELKTKERSHETELHGAVQQHEARGTGASESPLWRTAAVNGSCGSPSGASANPAATCGEPERQSSMDL